jgi:hypothetical protein
VNRDVVRNPIARFAAGLVLGLVVAGALAALFLTVSGAAFGGERHEGAGPAPHAMPHPHHRGEWR